MTDFNMWYWHNVRTDWAFQEWPHPIEDPLLHESGLLDTTPFLNTITKIFEKHGIHRKVAFGSTNANDGEFLVFDENHEPYDEIPKCVLGSCSLTPVLPATTLHDGKVMVDGGAAWVTNLISAVDRCKEEVEEDSQIVMDIMLCDFYSKLPTLADSGSTIDNYLRHNAIKNYYTGYRDIVEFMRTKPDIQYRYFAAPSANLTSGEAELINTPEILEPMIAMGIKDGKKIIEMGEGYYFEQLKKFAAMKDEGKTFSDFFVDNGHAE